MRKISQSQYLSNPNRCPACNAEDALSCDSVQLDSNIAWQDIWCKECGFSWTDEYTLTGMSEPCNIETDEQYEIVA